MIKKWQHVRLYKYSIRIDNEKSKSIGNQIKPMLLELHDRLW